MQKAVQEALTAGTRRIGTRVEAFVEQTTEKLTNESKQTVRNMREDPCKTPIKVAMLTGAGWVFLGLDEVMQELPVIGPGLVLPVQLGAIGMGVKGVCQDDKVSFLTELKNDLRNTLLTIISTIITGIIVKRMRLKI